MKPGIERGVVFLKSQQAESGLWPELIPNMNGGVSSLCTLALLQAGAKPDEPTIQKALIALRKIKPDKTYTVALQTMVFCAASPKVDAELIRHNVAWIEKTQIPVGRLHGGWSYQASSVGNGDGSNTRFAVMGLHAAKKAGFDVQAETWRQVSDYYLTTQTNEGGWSYSAQGPPSPTMTLAGVAGLATANRYLPQDEQTKTREAAIRKSAEYLEKVIPELQRASFALYALHCLERAGHVSGQSQFGKLEWKADMTKRLLDTQGPRGNWNGTSGTENDLIGTSLALLTLTGQPEPKLVGRRFKFEPREAGQKFHVLSSVNQNVVPPILHTEISGGVRIVLDDSDGTTWRIEADRALIESDEQQPVSFAINASNRISRIKYIGSVKAEGGNSRILSDQLELDLTQNDSIASQINSDSARGEKKPLEAGAPAKAKDAEAEAANRRVRGELKKLMEVAFTDTPLSDVMLFLGDYHNISMKLDESLKEQRKFLGDVPVTLCVTGEDLDAVLSRILHNQRLSYFVDGGELRIATPDEVRRLGHPVPESFAETLVRLKKADSSVPWERFLLGREWPENETRESWLKLIETLTKLLSHSEVVVQRHAASVLARFDEAAVHARPALEKLTKSEDRSVRQAAWQTLLAIGRQDLSTWPLFLAAWNNKDEYVREQWLMTLLQFHPRVFDELLVLFPTSSVEFRRACSASLRHRRERPSYEQLAILAMSDEDEETRYLSLRHARTEDPSQPFLSSWRRRLKDESPRCRVLAASNLLPLESDRLDALEVLLDEIGSADESRWPAAAQVITAYATVDYGGQFRDRLLRRSVTGDEQQRAVIRKALKFVPESRSHAAILQEIDAQLENVREDKRFPLAKRLEFLDELGRDRMNPNGSEELRARVGHHLAHYFAKWDLIAHNARVREYSLAALKLDVDADRRASLFSLVGSAALVDPAVPTFAEQRRNAAKLWLTGYREVVSLKLPKSAPELPVVEKLGDIAGEPPEQRAAREQQHATQLEARQQAEFIRRMVAHRHQLAHLLVETHRRDPANEPELRTLAKGVLVDKSLVEMLLAEGIVPQQ